MTSEEMRSLIHQARDCWITGDANAFALLFVPEGEFIVPGNRWVGREAIQKAAAEFASAHSEVKIEISRIITNENQAVVEWFWEDLDNHSGSQSQADDVIVVDFKDSLVSRWREYIDTRSRKNFRKD